MVTALLFSQNRTRPAVGGRPIAQARRAAVARYGAVAVGPLEWGPDGERRFAVKASLPWDGLRMTELMERARAHAAEVARSIRGEA